ncbi:hypothetical protein [Dokdonella sp.]|uniref:hypothetical protein n=1 Tax=Dokdonella sp. TaxID=2291710 RepID=UPI00378513A2
MKSTFVICMALGAAVALSGCGLRVPELRPLARDRDAEKIDENMIVNQVKCELTKGVQYVVSHPPTLGQPIDWIKDWGATVSLSITVDEKGGIAPGITFNDVRPNAITAFANGNVTTSQNYSTSLGFSGSAGATRKETIQFTYAFADLLQNHELPMDRPCDNEDGVRLHSDLKIAEFIENKMFVASVPGSTGYPPTGSPFTVFSDEITFVVAYAANLTPSWKLLRFSAGAQGGASFLSGSRTKTQSLVITLGLAKKTDGKKPQLDAEAQAVHQAALIGHAISSSLQGQ